MFYLYNFINAIANGQLNYRNNKNDKNDKKNVLLLGDRFFARGFLHNINYSLNSDPLTA